MGAPSVSKYEFLRELRHCPELNGEAPSYLRHAGTVAADERILEPETNLKHALRPHMQAKVAGKIWLTRRRRDGKLFVSKEYHDKDGAVKVAKESLLRLLNHPNLISLVDIVNEEDGVGGQMSYMVFEFGNDGTLNRRLWRAPDEDERQVGLCSKTSLDLQLVEETDWV